MKNNRLCRSNGEKGTWSQGKLNELNVKWDKWSSEIFICNEKECHKKKE